MWFNKQEENVAVIQLNKYSAIYHFHSKNLKYRITLAVSLEMRISNYFLVILLEKKRFKSGIYWHFSQMTFRDSIAYLSTVNEFILTCLV